MIRAIDVQPVAAGLRKLQVSMVLCNIQLVQAIWSVTQIDFEPFETRLGDRVLAR